MKVKDFITELSRLDPELDIRFEAEFRPIDTKTGKPSENTHVRPLPGTDVTAVRVDPKPYVMLRIGKE